MSGYTEDIEQYLRMCKYYKVEPQYKENGQPDVYGHGKKLWDRLQKERAGKPWRQIEEDETHEDNK